ncbi:MAG: DUF255 domain-containing protein [Bacteroidales bacterium]|jgi:thioredoxin-related protein|nr:DUF255 domain-containing protein [Bacteroidales bacterium]
MKKLFFISILISFFICTFGQKAKEIKWLTIQQALKLQDSIPKTIMIDMFTDWCGWCKKMDAETFHNPSIVDYVNENFYAVKFDAEGFDTVVYKGKTLINSRGGKRQPNDFALEMLGGRMSYPTIVYIDFEGMVNPVPGYMSAADIEPILIYFAERINKTADYQLYVQDFKNTFNPDETAKTSGEINWISIENCIELMKTNPKKIFLFVNSEYNNSSKIMLGSALRHPTITDYINKNFYAVKLDFDYQDTIKFADGNFINEKQQLGYPHQFIMAVLQPEIRLPSIVFFDEAFRIITPVKGYFPATTIERYLEFFSDNNFKTNEDWEKFNKNFKSKIQ